MKQSLRVWCVMVVGLGCVRTEVQTQTEVRLRVPIVSVGMLAPSPVVAPRRARPRTPPPEVATPTVPRCVAADGTALPVTRVVGGRGRFCSLHRGGEVCCWGRRLNGEEGDLADEEGWRFPHRIVDLPPVRDVVFGNEHLCALATNGSVFCWGADWRRPTGPRDLAAMVIPRRIEGLPTSEAITAFGTGTCVRSTDGQVRCWGSYDIHRADVGDLSEPRVLDQVPTLARFVDGAIPCGLDPQGALVCWLENRHVYVPHVSAGRSVVRFPGLRPSADMALNVHMHSGYTDEGCNLHPDGTVGCFGPNLGWCDPPHRNAFSEPRACEHPVTLGPSATRVVATLGSYCALLADQTVWCWGDNAHGTLGDGSTVSRYTPSQALGVDHITSLAGGTDAVCATRDDGTVLCWGDNRHGQLGYGGAPSVGALRATAVRFEGTLAPVVREPARPVTNLCAEPHGEALRQPAVIAMASGRAHQCALTAEGRVHCWGMNNDGQVGNREHDWEGVPTPTEVPELTDVTQIAAGGSNTCARQRSGTVWCWGNDSWGQINTRFSLVDRPLRWSPESFAEVAVSPRMICARRASGEVVCRGQDRANQGTPTMHLGARALQLSGAAGRVCALLANGRVACWRTVSDTPVVSEVFPARPGLMVAGEWHACALLDDHTVACWGDGYGGQLGLGTRGESQRPTRIEGLDHVIALSASASRTCATRDDGSLWCWGSHGSRGEAVSQRPEQESQLGPVGAVSLGGEHLCAVVQNGPVCCRGSNAYGLLGRGAVRLRELYPDDPNVSNAYSDTTAPVVW